MRTDQIKIVQGDITQFDGDAITNAANGYLLHGSGVAGAIKMGAGPALETVSELAPTLEPGTAYPTGGYNLPAKFIIHCVTMQSPGGKTNGTTINECAGGALRVADGLRCESLAFCLFGTGVGGFDLTDAAILQMVEVIEYTPIHLREVTFYGYDQSAIDALTHVHDIFGRSQDVAT
jgi:O-acetyl-ADP-ribose deacetylase (regulator of RNase III)